MSKNKNPFAKYSVVEKKAYIESLDSEVTYRPLTMVESDIFTSRIVRDYDNQGKPSFNRDEGIEIKYEKVALCLIEPKISVEELKALSGGALEAITEINLLIEGGVGEDDEKKN